MRRIGVIVAQSVAALLGVVLVFVSFWNEIMGPSFAAAEPRSILRRSRSRC